MILKSSRLGLNPEWGLIYYEAPITAQGLPEPSSLRGSTLCTRAAKHKGCNWAWKLTDGCSLKAVFGHTFWHMPQKKSQLNCMQRLCDWVKGRSISVSYIYILSISVNSLLLQPSLHVVTILHICQKFSNSLHSLTERIPSHIQ